MEEIVAFVMQRIVRCSRIHVKWGLGMRKDKSTYVQIPDADLTAETAGREQVVGGRVEGDAPRRPRVPGQRVRAAPGLCVRDAHRVVSVRRGDPSPASNTHNRKCYSPSVVAKPQ